MFVIYSRTFCSGCDTAKAFLNQENLEYEVKNIETDLDARTEFKALFPSALSVPKIVQIGGDADHLIETLEELYAIVKGGDAYPDDSGLPTVANI